MNTGNEKQSIKRLLEAEMKPLEDPDFALNIVNQYLNRKEVDRFRLFWNSDILSSMLIVLAITYVLIIDALTDFSGNIPGLNMTNDDRVTVLLIGVFWLVIRFFAEFKIVRTIAEKVKKMDVNLG